MSTRMKDMHIEDLGERVYLLWCNLSPEALHAIEGVVGVWTVHQDIPQSSGAMRVFIDPRHSSELVLEEIRLETAYLAAMSKDGRSEGEG